MRGFPLLNTLLVATLFFIAWWQLTAAAAIGFAIGAVLSGAAGFIGMHVAARLGPVTGASGRTEAIGIRAQTIARMA